MFLEDLVKIAKSHGYNAYISKSKVVVTCVEDGSSITTASLKKLKIWMGY